MAVEFEINNRNVVPNWRDFKRTLQLEELKPLPTTNLIEFRIDRALLDWKNDQTIGSAADLLNCSFVSGINDNPEIIKAYDFLKANRNQVPNTILEIAELAINRQTNSIRPNSIILEKEIESIPALIDNNNKLLVYKLLNRTRKKTYNELHNAIHWVELARLHSIVGNLRKAESAIVTALQLGPNNRFILRSATRFFIHSGNAERAIFYLRNAASIRKDPWLISAHISTSTLMGRFSPFLKIGNELVDSKNFSDFDLTELTSSIGTLHFNDGNIKKAQALLKISMKAPNDNSLAQQEWLSRKDSRFYIDNLSVKNVINPFEAHALEHFFRGQWQQSLENCLKWFLDTPYSKRPAILGSYIAGCLIDDYETGIAFCEAGLKANPEDAFLLNNLIYIHYIFNEYDKAEIPLQRFSKISITSLDDDVKTMIQATLGLVAIRNGKIDFGISAYQNAIEKAERMRNDYKKHIATINFARELVGLNHSLKEEYVQKVKDIKASADHPDLVHIQQKAVQYFKRNGL